MNSDLTHLLNTITYSVGYILKEKLTPHFVTMQKDKDTMKIIEDILKQMPDYKRLEKENEELKNLIQTMSVSAAPIKAPSEAPIVVVAPIVVAPIINEATVIENVIKLEVFDKPTENEVISESEIYKVIKLPQENKIIEAETEDEDEEDEYETDKEIDASEAEEEEEEEEAEEEEAEPSEADEEEAEPEPDAEEEEEPEPDASEPDTASEAEPDAEPDAGEPDASEADASEADASEADAEEEVFIIDIPNFGKFYTTNETNGDIYAIVGDDDVGDQVGKFVNKIATFI